MSDNERLWTQVDQYFTDLFVGADATLANALSDSSKAGPPDIAVAPNRGKLLHLLVRPNRSKRILEVGYDGIAIMMMLDPRPA